MFKINGLLWFLEIVPSYSPHLHRSDGSVTIGMCDNEHQTIYIDESLHGPLLKKVLCHELAHAAMFSYGVDLTIEQEEIVADIVATYGQEIIKMTNTLFHKLKNERL